MLPLGTRCHILSVVKELRWNAEKNQKLIEERGISFENVADYIERGEILEIFRHPNQSKYPGQQVFSIKIMDYVYLVPFVETESEIFLKTIIPSRQATKKHEGGK
jgi:uncharacterized DUF497 family protein